MKTQGLRLLARIKLVFAVQLLLSLSAVVSAQSPVSTPTPDTRGLGVQTSGTQTSSQAAQQAREAKPELVLQTGYNNFFGATGLVFSPDGRLLATGAYRSSTIKLWEISTGRELRDLSTGSQSSPSMSPAVAFSRDGRLIGAAAGNNSVKVWEVNTGREVQTLSGPEGSIASSFGVYFIGFGNDGQVVTVSDAIRVWDLNSGRELRTLASSSLDVAGLFGTDGAMTLTPDGSQLAIVRTEPQRQVKFYEVSTGKELRSANLPDKQIDSLQLSFAADGHLQVAGILNKRLKLWDLSSKQNDRDLGPTKKDYSQIKFSRDGRLLALSESYNVKLWEVASGKELTAVNAPNTGAFIGVGEAMVAFSEDGKRLATGGFDTQTIVWDIETAKQLIKMNGRTNMAYNVLFSADGNRLSSGGRTVWDLRTGRGLRIAGGTREMMMRVQSPDGKLIAEIKPNNGIITVFDTSSVKQVRTLDPGSTSMMVEHARFSTDSSKLVVTYGTSFESAQTVRARLPTNSVKIWDVKTGSELHSLSSTASPSDARFSEDGHTVGTIGSMGQISLWDADSGAKLRDLTSSPMPNLNSMGTMGNVKPGSMPSISNMPSMPNMADLSAMMTNMMGTMAAGTGGRTTTSLAFSPDGKILATGGFEAKSNFDFAAMMTGAMNQGRKPKKNAKIPDSDDLMKDLRVEAIGQVRLWDVASGRELTSLKGHGKGVNQIAFSRDGRLLASAGTDNTIKIWEVQSGRELRTLTGHTASIESIDFSPDARLMASAGDDGSTFLWDARTGEHLLTLISLDDGGEWMVVTPQGLFDGTPVSWNQILWRYNQDTFNVAPIELFFNEFYYPGLLADIFNGKRPRVAQDVSKKDRRQATVKLSLAGGPAAAITSRIVKLKIEVTDAPADKEHSSGTGARDLRLFRNGSLVKVWHGDVLKGQATITLEEEITATAGENRLVAYAFNGDNVKSTDAPLVFNGADSLKRKGTAYILAVGVNEYANDQYNLKYAVADAQSFGEEVRSKQTQIGDFARVEVIPLLNENATKANILGVLARLAGATVPQSQRASQLDNIKRVEPEDTVIIYFAGHGTAQQQRFYLIPHDLGYTGDRTKLTEDGLKMILAHSVSDLELEAAVEGLDAGHLVLVIDACNSGQALEAEEKRRGPMNSKGLAQLAYEKGMYILTAAQSFQAALEAAQLGHGLLTYALVEEGLKTSIADNEPKDGIVNAREWLDFATERVPQMQEEKMQQGRGVGLELSFTEGEKEIADPQKRTVQRPRVFYRRELEANPLVMVKP